MKRFLACAVIAVIGNASAAFAGESLLTSGTRHVQQIAAAPAAASYQEGGGPGNLSKSGHSKMTKVMIYAALGVGFAFSAWEIDRHVLNITPSSLGQRKD